MIWVPVYLVVGALVILKVGGLVIDWLADNETEDGSL